MDPVQEIFSSTARPQLGKIQCQLHKTTEHINSDLFLDVQKWLKLRGKTCRPKLTDEQKAQLRTCFDLMDADGSGAIDAEELSEAFELLGMNYTRAEIQELLDDVDRDGSGECEYPEFVEIMTISLSRIREEQEKSGDKQGPDISFDLMATAYRRKRLMEGLMSGDRDVQNQILSMASSQLAAHEAAVLERARPANRESKYLGNEQDRGCTRLGASEHAVIRSLAGRLPAVPKTDEPHWQQDLEKLARFGMAGIQKLKKPSAESVIEQVLPHITHSTLLLPNTRQVLKIQQCLRADMQKPNAAPVLSQRSAVPSQTSADSCVPLHVQNVPHKGLVRPARYILCKHKPKVLVRPSKAWSSGLTMHRGATTPLMPSIREEGMHHDIPGRQSG